MAVAWPPKFDRICSIPIPDAVQVGCVMVAIARVRVPYISKLHDGAAGTNTFRAAGMGGGTAGGSVMTVTTLNAAGAKILVAIAITHSRSRVYISVRAICGLLRAHCTPHVDTSCRKRVPADSQCRGVQGGGGGGQGDRDRSADEHRGCRLRSTPHRL